MPNTFGSKLREHRLSRKLSFRSFIIKCEFNLSFAGQEQDKSPFPVSESNMMTIKAVLDLNEEEFNELNTLNSEESRMIFIRNEDERNLNEY